MPAQSALPLINAAALAIAIVSITISWWLVGAAMLVFLWTALRWVRDVKRDIADLPLEHSHHEPRTRRLRAVKEGMVRISRLLQPANPEQRPCLIYRREDLCLPDADRSAGRVPGFDGS